MTIHKSPIMMSMLALFLILVIATGYRIITALETHPGLVVEDAYLSGERYGDTLSKKQLLSQQGWSLNLEIPKDVAHNVEQTYKAISMQKDKVFTDAKMVIYFYRPLERKFDFSKTMSPDASGVYQAQIKLPFKGRWDVIVEATKGDFLQRSSAKMFAK